MCPFFFYCFVIQIQEKIVLIAKITVSGPNLTCSLKSMCIYVWNKVTILDYKYKQYWPHLHAKDRQSVDACSVSLPTPMVNHPLYRFQVKFLVMLICFGVRILDMFAVCGTICIWNVFALFIVNRIMFAPKVWITSGDVQVRCHVMTCPKSIIEIPRIYRNVSKTHRNSHLKLDVFFSYLQVY